jgi:DNA-binding transcriptional ArsR family regulator
MRTMIQTRPAALDLMACLGEPSRYRLVRALIGGPRCVTDLASEVGLSQSCTTRHLQALERRNVVRGTRDGKRVLYAIRQDRADLMPLIGWAMGRFATRASAPATPPEVRQAVISTPKVGPARSRNGTLPGPGPPGSRKSSGMTSEMNSVMNSGTHSGMTSGTHAAAPIAPAPPEPEPPPRRRAGDLEDFLL